MQKPHWHSIHTDANLLNTFDSPKHIEEEISASGFFCNIIESKKSTFHKNSLKLKKLTNI